MIRLVLVADLHLDVSTAGLPDRRRDLEQALDNLIEDCSRLAPSLVIFAGDLFDTKRPSPWAISLFVTTVRALARMGVWVIVIPGNHDGPEAIEEPEGKVTGWLRAMDMPNVWAVVTAEVASIPTRDGPVQVAAIPYPHKRSFDKDEAMRDLSVLERTAAVGKATEGLIRSMLASLDGPGPKVFTGHLSVERSHGGAFPNREGGDAFVSADVFDGYDFAALGHVHDRLDFGKAAYPGPPVDLAWGLTWDSGWLVVDLADDGKEISRSMRSSRTPRMLDVVEGQPWEVAAGQYARVTVKNREYGKRAAMMLLAAGARAVVLKMEEAPVVNRDAQRQLDVTGMTPESMLRAWCAANDVPVSDVPALVSALHDLVG